MSHYRKKNPPQKFKFDEKQLEALRWMAGIRIPMHEMATFFKDKEGKPLSVISFKDKVRHDFAAQHAIEEGKANATRNVRQRLYSMAMGQDEYKDGKPTGRFVKGKEPNFAALRFWCETQEGFKRAEKLEVSGVSMPLVTINLPRNGREPDDED